MNKKIYVIIVTWNGMKWIKRCFDALRESTFPVNIVVIDNGSTDETVSFIKENYSEVHLIESEKNLGFGQANNEGMRYALANSCDYVYLLNQDAYVYPDMFQLLIDEAEKKENQEQYAIYSPLHVNSDIHKLDNQFRGYLKNIAPLMVEDVCLSELKSIYPVDGVPAAGWLIPKKTLDTIGGFDPIFFHYGEDDHYCQRVIYHGMKVGVVPSAKMIHDRNNFGNAEMANKDGIYRGQKLYTLLNINLTGMQRFLKFLKSYSVFFVYSFKCLKNGNFSLVGEFFTSFFKVLFHLGQFSNNRKQNKKIGPNWL